MNIQAHEHLNLKVHMHLTVQLHLDLTNLIKACAQASNYLNISISKRIDISTIKYVHMWFKNKSYLGETLNLYVLFKLERIHALDHESIQSCDH